MNTGYKFLTSTESSMNDSDLDNLNDQALKWQKVLIENFAKITNLQLEKQDLQKSITEVQKQLTTRQSESNQLLEQVKSLQAIIAQQCDLEDENCSLKQKLAETEQKFLTETEVNREMVTKLEETIKTNEGEFNVKLTELERQSKKEATEEKEELERKLGEKYERLTELHQKLTRQQCEHQRELDRLKQDFEDRLKKAKEQTKQQSSIENSASYMACKDIFRKKWDQAKTQYETEITSLRTQLAAVENRRARPQAQPRAPAQPRQQAKKTEQPRAQAGRPQAGPRQAVPKLAPFQPNRTSTPTDAPPNKKRK